MTGYDKLNVWQESMELVVMVYELIKSLPDTEKYILSDQIRRSVISIPSNIAEGSARNSKKEFKQFLYIASGSLYELETHLQICLRLGYFENLDYVFKKTEIIKKTINSLITSLKCSKN